MNNKHKKMLMLMRMGKPLRGGYPQKRVIYSIDNFYFDMEDVVEKLKEIIEDKGPGYLSAEPYKVYKKLLKDKVADKKTVGALLMIFANGIADMVRPETDLALLSKLIQTDCCFNKKMSDRLAAILISLYSQENEDE